MKSLINKDIKQRILYSKIEFLRLYYKAISVDTRINIDIRNSAMFKLRNFSKNCLHTRIKNFCLLTGRRRGVFRKFGLCRFQLKMLAKKGSIHNFKKSS